ncbi:hypothetical protein ES703_51029 [subsurface metagenome]
MPDHECDYFLLSASVTNPVCVGEQIAFQGLDSEVQAPDKTLIFRQGQEVSNIDEILCINKPCNLLASKAFGNGDGHRFYPRSEYLLYKIANMANVEQLKISRLNGPRTELQSHCINKYFLVWNEVPLFQQVSNLVGRSAFGN